MVQLTCIYTRGGDKGKTSLGGGERITKFDARIEAIGAVDELNAAIGVVCLHVSEDMLDILKRIQNDLFDMGADLCIAQELATKLKITDIQVERLEHDIDQINSELAPLKSFILPGGTAASAYFHLARTIARRAEREVVRLAAEQTINPTIIRYLNRLSDLLFVLARYLNDKGQLDILWKPGETQSQG